MWAKSKASTLRLAIECGSISAAELVSPHVALAWDAQACRPVRLLVAQNLQGPGCGKQFVHAGLGCSVISAGRGRARLGLRWSKRPA